MIKLATMSSFGVVVIMVMGVMISASNSKLCSSSCGDIHNITSPFRLTADPIGCGDQRYNLSCENNITVLYFNVFNYTQRVRLYVLSINYNNYTIRLAYPDVHQNDCSSIPILGLSSSNLDSNDEYITYIPRKNNRRQKNSKNVVFLSCESPVMNSSYIEASTPCRFNDAFSSTPLDRTKNQNHSYLYYYIYSDGFSVGELYESCGVVQVALIAETENVNVNTSYDIHNALLYGFQLSFVKFFYPRHYSEDHCYVDDSNSVRCSSYYCGYYEYLGVNKCGIRPPITFILGILNDLAYDYYFTNFKHFVIAIEVIMALRIVFGIFFLVALLNYIRRKSYLSVYDGIEAFLRSQNNLIPIIYSYRDIKRMTKGFKDKLGEGGFGSVYEGKLRSGRLVAIKMLSNAKVSSGQDFINEVATIGRIHHVNVVRLIGFSFNGSKRALVYEFMPNGSLDKYIFSQEEIQTSLSSKQMFEISLGIARGIEYLHRGCDMKILHFDIKPHNILLDENFIPKVSDFGLARLCPTDDSIVSITAARGTIGYMAPELFYKNIGGVSQKADVYSYGMMLMEMVNRRRNLNAEAERSSQIYFPLWIHSQLSQGCDFSIENATEEDSKAIKKMIIVSLWCIQLKPCDRPSMNKVIEMLEGEVESLEMPPKVELFPQENYGPENTKGSNKELRELFQLMSNSD